LRLAGPANAPAEASGAKFFWLGEFGTIAAIATVKARTSASCGALAQHHDAQRHVVKTRVSSALLQREQIFSRACAAEKFIGSHFSENCAASAP
jgi:hypothetical protein